MKRDVKPFDPDRPFDLPAADFKLSKSFTALLVIDLQTDNLKYVPESEFSLKYPDIANYWNKRIGEIVLPNVKMLIDVFRYNKLKIVFTRNGTLTPVPRESTPQLENEISLFGHSTECCKEKPHYETVEQLAPKEDDLILDKLTSGAFTATFLDHIFKKMNVTDIVITGILTDMCVLDTARTAAELGYNVIVCDDACAAVTPKAHNDALVRHARTFGRVATATEIIDELQ